MSKIRDVDYLTLSARIHAMETRLLTEERMDRMIDARDTDEAAKVLTECGYGELSEPTGDGVERMLTEAQAELFRDLGATPWPNRLSRCSGASTTTTTPRCW